MAISAESAQRFGTHDRRGRQEPKRSSAAAQIPEIAPLRRASSTAVRGAADSLLFSIIGVPLAAFGFVGSRAKGVLAALVLLGAYYALFIFCYDGARSGHFPPAPAVWFSNLMVFLVGLALLLASARSHR
jgi:hypothetical protein